MLITSYGEPDIVQPARTDMAAAAEYGCDFAHINQLVGAEAYFEDLRLQLIQEDRYVNAFCIF